MPKLNIIDCDDGVMAFDIVPVPEGFSFQMYDRGEPIGYQSVIVSPGDCAKLIRFLQGEK